MGVLAGLCEQDPAMLQATAWHEVYLDDDVAVARSVACWEELTRSGGEGIVMKPASFVAHGLKGLVQPALKVRGREYLRLIYGPEYTLPGKLERLRERGLAGKRRLAVREFALGLEALTRCVAAEPLRRVHECVFGVLALESEPIDPRL
jgi:protein phosphatase